MKCAVRKLTQTHPYWHYTSLSFGRHSGNLNSFTFSGTLGPGHKNSHSSNANVLSQFHFSVHFADFLYLIYFPYISPKDKFYSNFRATHVSIIPLNI